MRQSQNVAGALTLASHRDGVTPDRVALGNDGERAFAIQGQQAETQRYSQVAVNVSMQTPLVETSRQAVSELNQGQLNQGPSQGQPTAPQQTNTQAQQDPAQEQVATGRGR